MMTQIGVQSNPSNKNYPPTPVPTVPSATKAVSSAVATKHAENGSATKKDKTDLPHTLSSI